MRRRKAFLTGLLAVTMSLGTLSVPVFAAEQETMDVSKEYTDEAADSIGDTQIYTWTGSCGENITYTITGNDEQGYSMTISGSGAMYDYTSTLDVPWSAPFGNMKVVVEPGVTSIGNWAFAVWDTDLVSITLPEGLVSIGEYAFYGCGNLKTVTIPDSVQNISESAFLNCGNLVIEGYVETVSEQYAEEHGLAFAAIPEAAEILEQPVSVSTSLNATAAFHVKAKNAASYQWQYSKNGGKTWYKSTATGAETESISLKVSGSNKNSIYRCKVIGTDGSASYSEAAGIEVLPAVVITAQPQNSNASIGEQAVFSVSAEGAASYQWYYSKDNGASWYKSTVSGSDTEQIQLKATKKNQAMLYRCKLTNGEGASVYSEAAGFVG